MKNKRLLLISRSLLNTKVIHVKNANQIETVVAQWVSNQT